MKRVLQRGNLGGKTIDLTPFTRPLRRKYID